MDMHRIRNVIPVVYALLILGGFLISPGVGVAVVIVGGMLSGLAWSTLGRGGSDGRQRDRGAARARRRSGRR